MRNYSVVRQLSPRACLISVSRNSWADSDVFFNPDQGWLVKTSMELIPSSTVSIDPCSTCHGENNLRSRSVRFEQMLSVAKVRLAMNLIELNDSLPSIGSLKSNSIIPRIVSPTVRSFWSVRMNRKLFFWSSLLEIQAWPSVVGSVVCSNFWSAITMDVRMNTTAIRSVERNTVPCRLTLSVWTSFRVISLSTIIPTSVCVVCSIILGGIIEIVDISMLSWTNLLAWIIPIIIVDQKRNYISSLSQSHRSRVGLHSTSAGLSPKSMEKHIRRDRWTPTGCIDTGSSIRFLHFWPSELQTS